MLAELWISFTSVLRAYAAAASLGMPSPQAIVEQIDTEVYLRGARRTVRVAFTPQSGEGAWEIFGDSNSSSGLFTLLPDGTFRWSGSEGQPQMDELAESLVTLVAE